MQEKQLKIEFGFGVGEDQRGAALQNTAEALGFIVDTAVDLFGGYTLLDGRGGWRNGAGRLVEELCKTLVVYITGSLVGVEHRPDIYTMIQEIKHRLNQEAVAVTITEVIFNVV